jgi:hypothetical protein
VFESEQAASSRLQFISRLAGGAASASLLAACGGLRSSQGSSLLVPASPALAKGAAAKSLQILRDTQEFQTLLFKTDCVAVTHGGIAVIRNDLKGDPRLINRTARILASVKKKNGVARRHPHNRMGGGDGGDIGGGYIGDYTFTVDVFASGDDDIMSGDDFSSGYDDVSSDYQGGDFGPYHAGPVFTFSPTIKQCVHSVYDGLKAFCTSAIAAYKVDEQEFTPAAQEAAAAYLAGEITEVALASTLIAELPATVTLSLILAAGLVITWAFEMAACIAG